MSVNSSEEDVVGPGAGGGVGSALAVLVTNAESPITAPTTADNSPLRSFSLVHSLIPAKLAPDRIRRMLNTTNV
jgi:hypothetical protein